MHRIVCLALTGLMLRGAPLALGEGLALLVPAYFEPKSGEWERLAEAARRVPLVAIANIFNGPGGPEAPRPEYVQAMRGVRDAGGQVIAYVYTQYGKRASEVVKSDMGRWHEGYPIDGFFVDEMANDLTTASLEYYAQLQRYARELHPRYQVVGNPGTNTEEAYLKRPAADVVVIFEHHTGYPEFVPAAWTKRYPRTQFGHLTYAVPSTEVMTNFVHLAATRRAGFIYVTDDSGNNPWDTLPSYWEAELATLEQLNQAAAQSVRAQLSLSKATGPILSLVGQGAVGRHVLESSSPLGDWRAVQTNLTNTGTSTWQILNLPPNRFFRMRQD